jgi:hypothetical protein
VIEYFVIYDLADGREIFRGSGPAGTVALQQPGDGRHILPISAEAVNGSLEEALPELKASLWAQVRGIRDAVVDGGVNTSKGRLDSDLVSRTNLAGAVTAAMLASQNGQPFTVDWTLADNSVAEMSGPEIITVGLEVVAHVDATHAVARAYREQIDAATTLTELLTIDILAGWN